MGTVVAVNSSTTHSFSKASRDGIQLIAGFGVEGDSHAGATVKHRSRVELIRRSRTYAKCILSMRSCTWNWRWLVSRLALAS